MKNYSGAALTACLVCDFLWSIIILAACTYLVFWRDESGWWYVLAIILCSAWNCQRYRSPEQIAADKQEEGEAA